MKSLKFEGKSGSGFGLTLVIGFGLLIFWFILWLPIVTNFFRMATNEVCSRKNRKKSVARGGPRGFDPLFLGK